MTNTSDYHVAVAITAPNGDAFMRENYTVGVDNLQGATNIAGARVAAALRLAGKRWAVGRLQLWSGAQEQGTMTVFSASGSPIGTVTVTAITL